jgi:hypothetical protein
LIDGIGEKISDLKDALGGITSLIPDWKGPADRDAALLRPNGRLIMGGLMDGIGSVVPSLQSQLSGITDAIAATQVPALELPVTIANTPLPSLDVPVASIGQPTVAAVGATAGSSGVAGALPSQTLTNEYHFHGDIYQSDLSGTLSAASRAASPTSLAYGDNHGMVTAGA